MLSCCKYFVVFYNFLFWLLGVVILAFSAYLWWDFRKYYDPNDVPNAYLAPLYVLLVLGGVMTMVGFLGCCGAVRESSCLLGTYFLLCITMCVACGASLFWAIQNEDMVPEKIKKDTTKLMQEDYGHGHTNATEMLVDRIQRDFECCGVMGPADWMNSSYNRNKSGAAVYDVGVGSVRSPVYNIPQSCCKPNVNCVQYTTNMSVGPAISSITSIYQEGCIDKIEKFVKEKWRYIIITEGVLIGVQIIGLFFACVLCCVISRVGDK